MDTVFEGLGHIIGNAETLAKLGAIGAWVFFTLVLLIHAVWLQRLQSKGAEDSYNARIEEAKSSIMMANALTKLADEIREKCGEKHA